jgi:hypothetical protein
MIMSRPGSALALVAITLDLIGCGTSHDTADKQFQRQAERARQCQQMQNGLVGNQRNPRAC